MKFLKSNKVEWRLLRTIVQGIIAVVVSNVDLIIGSANIPDEWRSMIVAIVMAILSPVMALLGGGDNEQ